MTALDRTPRRIDKPEPGFWLMRLRKGAPEVPAAIKLIHTRYEPALPTNLMERSPFLAAFIRGEAVSLSDVWERRGRPITEAEYEYQLRLSGWAKTTTERTPLAQPRETVDLGSLPPLF